MTRRLAMGLVAIGALGWCLIAGAKSATIVPYPTGEVWPTAVRYLRIDRGCTIREKDAESGYILFDLPEGGKTFKGALELIPTTDGDGRNATRVIFTLPDLARHYEIAFNDKLASKLKDDHGSPAPAPPRKRPSPEPPRGKGDAGSPPANTNSDPPR